MTREAARLESDIMDKASANLEIVHGKGGDITVFDVCFLRGAKASHTLTAATVDGVRVYVDIGVGDRSSPVAITLIHRSDLSAPKYTEVPPSGAEPLYGDLKRLAEKIIKLDKDGFLPKPIVMRRGKPTAAAPAPPRTDLPVPNAVRWRPD